MKKENKETGQSPRERVKAEVAYLIRAIENKRGEWVSKKSLGHSIGMNTSLTKDNQKLQTRISRVKASFLEEGQALVNEPSKGYQISRDPDLIMAEAVKSIERALGSLRVHIALVKAATDTRFNYGQFDEVSEATKTIAEASTYLREQAEQLKIKINSKPTHVQNELDLLKN